MASQEFLASFAVDIDEGGVSRLQAVLGANRDLTNEVAAAFEAATAAIKEYQDAAAGVEMPGGGTPGGGTPGGKPTSSKSSPDAGDGSPSEPDRTGWHYVAEYDRWMPNADTAMRNLAQLQLSGVLTGDNAPATPTNARELVLQNMETMFLGQASRDSSNAARNLISWEDIGLTSNPLSSDLWQAAEDIIREPIQQAREYMQQAIEAEEAGLDGSEYVSMMDDVLRKPMEQIKALVDEYDFGSLGDDNGGDGSEGSEEGMTGELNLDAAREELEAFKTEAAQPIAMTGDANAVVTAASSALARVRSMLSSPLVLQVRANVTKTEGNDDGGTVQMSTGGRFSKPTNVEVAEDGDTEYIIPVKKDEKAIPLLRQMLNELSPAAKAALNVSGGSLAIGGGDLAAGNPSAGNITQNNQNVSAPVSIQVHASGASAEKIGESLYETTERYLLRTLQGVFA